MYRAALPLAQLGVGFVPGLGHGVNAAIGAGLALADGKPITEAMIEAVKSAIPGGPLAKMALDVGMRSAVDLASGKRFDAIALEAVRRHLPGGEAAKIAFDTGLALAQGKKIQDVGLAAVGRFVPNNPLAQGAFEMTKRVIAGKPPQGSTRAAMKSLGTRLPPPARPVLRKPIQRSVRVHPIAPRPTLVRPVESTPMRAPFEAPLETSEDSSSAVPFVLGIAALAAAGGGAWWWSHHREKKRPH
jgi:hypothetical protein